MEDKGKESGINFVEEAKISILNQNYGEAKKFLDMALKNNPNDPEAHYLLGLLFEMTNKLEDARMEYKRALELDPNHKEASERLFRLLSIP